MYTFFVLAGCLRASASVRREAGVCTAIISQELRGLFPAAILLSGKTHRRLPWVQLSVGVENSRTGASFMHPDRSRCNSYVLIRESWFMVQTWRRTVDLCVLLKLHSQSMTQDGVKCGYPPHQYSRAQIVGADTTCLFYCPT